MVIGRVDGEEPYGSVDRLLKRLPVIALVLAINTKSAVAPSLMQRESVPLGLIYSHVLLSRGS